MVGMSDSGSGKYLNGEWHAKREAARTETYSLEEWGDIDITKWDLDTVEFDRSQKDSTHVTETHVDAEAGANGGVDVRKYPTLNYPE